MTVLLIIIGAIVLALLIDGLPKFIKMMADVASVAKMEHRSIQEEVMILPSSKPQERPTCLGEDSLGRIYMIESETPPYQVQKKSPDPTFQRDLEHDLSMRFFCVNCHREFSSDANQLYQQ